MPFRRGDPNINRKGAPKREWTWSGVLQEAMDFANETGEPMKVGVAKSLVQQALKGNVLAIKEIMNRMDGMPMQQTDITSDGEKLGSLIVYKPQKNES